ncbi:Hypothetical protein R9X50_00125000 [Acrodontium crateriforme]|uniref:Protein kinase domain-containing protein n=1 Tax=Acrodontium crateriforme TaxID=150365 RepID=A0AAQ3M0F7_9PEZI|nr:Hypothetical protein R9X50_00125000 [Acrodontium crateriforme]
MEGGCIVYSSNFLGNSPHSMVVWHAGMQYSIRISPDTLVGTGFHSTYEQLRAKLNQKAENGLPLHSPFKFIEDLQQLVWKACTSVSEAYANRKPREPANLQCYIQPLTIHIALAKDARAKGGVGARIIGDISSNYPWDTSRAAQTNNHITNSYSWDIAPARKQDLELGPTVQMIQGSELFIAQNSANAGPMQQVQTATGTQYFFKPRMDCKAPEFDREVSLLGAIIKYGLNKKLKVSPFKGLVVLENSLVVGMLFEWLKGWPLAEHPELSNPRFHKRWQEQVGATVNELHQHKIVWGDVNVHNIFIDANADAWVIDFGGNYNIQFVDKELKETYEGDLQGLRRIFDEWIPVTGKQ